MINNVTHKSYKSIVEKYFGFTKINLDMTKAIKLCQKSYSYKGENPFNNKYVFILE